MKYLITEHQVQILKNIADCLDLTSIKYFTESLKPIEPLSANETQDLVENWFADEWAQVQAIGLLRDYEAHILGERK